MVQMYLDDLRKPKTNKDWVILRSSNAAIDYVKEHGMPEFASFDHDLGGDDTAIVFLKWLIEYDMDNGNNVIPKTFNWSVHSANPVGAKNIDGLLQSYMKTKK